jgi:hypothetical protein
MRKAVKSCEVQGSECSLASVLHTDCGSWLPGTQIHDGMHAP